ncbi:MAG TPA: cytochrome c3 family protein [Desulfobacteria bacterium]|nr:cytochrome c3 family protein [Desulfobacteria bacterium]
MHNVQRNLRASPLSPRFKIKLFILATGCLLVGLITTIGITGITASPTFCQTCHEMRPEYVTWKASAHSQISCLDCHSQPGTNQLITQKTMFLKELYDHLIGNINTPISLDDPTPDVVCEKCHTDKRVATPSGDIKIPHKAHKARGIPCMACHSAVAHAEIAENGFTADGNWQKWIEPVGKVYMRQDFLKFSMAECLDCHQELSAGPGVDQCDACHTKFIKPASHKDKQFLIQHGRAAFKDINQCDQCHKVTKFSKAIQTRVSNPVVQYARSNDFCSNCHRKTKPANHTAVDWRKQHGKLAQVDRNGCLICHDDGKPSRKDPVTKTYCYKCHVSQLHSALQNGHPRFPLGPNPEIARNPCFRCHPVSNCAKCHYVPTN